jgi:hypothetical protein
MNEIGLVSASSAWKQDINFDEQAEISGRDLWWGSKAANCKVGN